MPPFGHAFESTGVGALDWGQRSRMTPRHRRVDWGLMSLWIGFALWTFIWGRACALGLYAILRPAAFAALRTRRHPLTWFATPRRYSTTDMRRAKIYTRLELAFWATCLIVGDALFLTAIY